MARVFVHRETVRFRDLDPMGHVNNAVYDLAYELRAGDRVVAEARTVLVTYDYVNAAPIDIPAEWRERLAA
jgi:acyl-CoA thioesterase FadM